MKKRSENEESPPETDERRLIGPFSLTPTHLLLGASLPLCIGTYAGYKRQLKIVEKEAAEHAAVQKGELLKTTLTHESKLVARRALGIGTLVSISGFGLLTSVVFYASGCRSWDDAVILLHTNGRIRRRQLENWLGIDFSVRDGHPDVVATRNMTDDQELDYYSNKYFSDDAAPEEAAKSSSTFKSSSSQ